MGSRTLIVIIPVNSAMVFNVSTAMKSSSRRASKFDFFFFLNHLDAVFYFLRSDFFYFFCFYTVIFILRVRHTGYTRPAI